VFRITQSDFAGWKTIPAGGNINNRIPGGPIFGIRISPKACRKAYLMGGITEMIISCF
jgi:hypothetical protein